MSAGRSVVAGGRRFELWTTDVGLACCAVEVVAASAQLDAADDVPPGDVGGEVVHVLVVSGTVTDVLAPGVVRMYESLPEPRRVLSFGSCSNSGGPYWDSYSVTKGVDQLLPVDVYVPGCPPRPEALLAGLRELAR